jgi:hypothetical protein
MRPNNDLPGMICRRGDGATHVRLLRPANLLFLQQIAFAPGSGEQFLQPFVSLGVLGVCQSQSLFEYTFIER